MTTEKPYYLAGPMSGIPQFNFPLFIRATKMLREAGYNIVSPAELDAEHGLDTQAMGSKDGDASKLTQTWGDLLARDVKIISDVAQGIIFLPNWFTSRGAKLEAFVALLNKHKFGVFLEESHPLVTWIPAHQVLAQIAVNMQGMV
jgi:hypothetical protein